MNSEAFSHFSLPSNNIVGMVSQKRDVSHSLANGLMDMGIPPAADVQSSSDFTSVKQSM